MHGGPDNAPRHNVWDPNPNETPAPISKMIKNFQVATVDHETKPRPCLSSGPMHLKPTSPLVQRKRRASISISHDTGRLYLIPAIALNSCNNIPKKVRQFNRWKKLKQSTVPKFYNLKVMEIGFESRSGFSQSLPSPLCSVGSEKLILSNLS